MVNSVETIASTLTGASVITVTADGHTATVSMVKGAELYRLGFTVSEDGDLMVSLDRLTGHIEDGDSDLALKLAEDTENAGLRGGGLYTPQYTRVAQVTLAD